MSEGECSNLSFEEIYEAYFAKMKRFSKEYVLSDEDAENIVHDVFFGFMGEVGYLFYKE